MQSNFLICIGLILGLSMTTAAQAEHRVALVIGNSNYGAANKLANPANDAEDIGNVLQELGFDVFQGTDLTLAGFDRILRRYRDALKTADVALLFYAGHGASVNGTNYLIPVDTKFDSARDFTQQAISLRDLQKLMEYRPRINLLFFDACRNNPFLRKLSRSAGGAPAVKQGWADVAPSQETYISFASAEGEVASDGTGRNSPFTAALLKHIATPGKDVQIMMRDVRKQVIEVTNKAQIPWEKASMVSKFVFATGPENEEQITVKSDKASYRKGEKLKLFITPKEDCRLTLLNIDKAGKSCLLFPHPKLPDMVLKAGKKFSFPPKGSLRLDEPGEESFIAMCNASSEARQAARRNTKNIDCSKGAADRKFNDQIFETVTFDLDDNDEPEERQKRNVLRNTLTVTVSDQ